MVNYECKLCNYKTIIRTHYNKHLTTNKHKRKTVEENEWGETLENKKVINETEMNQNEPQMNQNEPQMNQNEPQMNQQIEKNYECELCSIEFNTKASLRRHELHRCKEEKGDDTLYNKEKQWGKEKKILYKQITALIKKAGNTTTNTNNINLNSYGNEDLSHITNSFKTQMLKGPFEMIPKMIEEVHFNDKKPENKNICYPNKKNNNVKIFKEGKWKYYNKEDLMDELMGNNYCILDVYYDEKKDDILSDIQKKRYLNFKDIYNSGKLDKGTKGEINLLLLNCDEY